MNIRSVGGLGLVVLGCALGMAACGTDPNSQATTSGMSSSSSSSGGSSSGGSGSLMDASIVIGSCLPDDGVNRWLWRIYSELPGPEGWAEKFACLATAGGGCKAVETCLGFVVEPAPMPCAPECNGNTLTFCDDGMKITADCSKMNTTCSASAVECVPTTTPPACDPATYVPTCKDGVPTMCSFDGYETTGLLCADLGLTCGTPPFGDIACMGTGGTCDPSLVSPSSVTLGEGIACKGTTLQSCVNGGLHDVDCSKLVPDSTCQTLGMVSYCGFATECDPTAGQDSTCDGDNIVLCNAGRTEKVDCKSLGFTGCNTTWGTCSPSIYDAFGP